MKNLVYAELTDGISFQMLADQKVYLISDNALFLVTFKEHSENYPSLEFYETDINTVKEYGQLPEFLSE